MLFEPTILGQRHASHFRECAHELVLKAHASRLCRRRLPLAMEPIPATDARARIIAHRKPGLRQVSLFEVIGRCGATMAYTRNLILRTLTVGAQELRVHGEYEPPRLNVDLGDLPRPDRSQPSHTSQDGNRPS